MTNFEKIKAMSVEEMAEFLVWNTDDYFEPYCGWKEWLKRDAEELESEVEEDG